MIGKEKNLRYSTFGNRESFSNEIEIFKLPIKFNDNENYTSLYNYSILSLSLIELYDLSEEKIETIWSSSDDPIEKYFYFQDETWNRLNLIQIYKDDPVSAIITQNLFKIQRCFVTNDELFSLFSYCRHFIKSSLGQVAYTLPYRKYCQLPIIYEETVAEIRNFSLNLFNLPHDTLKVLNELGYSQFGDLVSLSESKLIEKYGLCKKSILIIKAIWDVSNNIDSIKFIFTCLGKYPNLNTSFPEYITGVLMHNCKHSRTIERDIKVGLFYLLNKKVQQAVDDDKSIEQKTTLDLIGKKFGITRERIRQIIIKIKKKLISKSTSDALSWLWINIYNIIYKKGGAIVLIDISNFLENLMHDQLPNRDFLQLLVESNPCVEYDSQNDIVFLKNWPCLKCKSIFAKLNELLCRTGNIHSKTPINRELLDFCENNCSNPKKLFTPNYSLLCCIYKLEKDVVITEEGNIYKRPAWNEKTSSDFAPILGLIDLL